MLITLRRLALPLFLGLLVTWLANLYLTQAARPAASVELTPVLVATRMIPARTTLTSDMLSQKKVPRELVSSQTLTRFDEAVGRLTVVPLAEGEILLKSKLAGTDEKTALAYHIPEGRRAITIAINDVIGVGGYLEAGDHVDVLATFPKNIAGEEKTVLLLEDIPVLALAKDKNTTTKEVKGPSSTITLAVTPEEAGLLTFAEERGSLRLLLRPVRNDGRWGEMQVSGQLFTASTVQPLISELKSRLLLRAQLFEVEKKALSVTAFGYKGDAGFSLAQVPGKTQASLNELLRQGRAKILETADLLTWNRDPVYFRLTEKLPVTAPGGQDLLTWQEYGLTLTVSTILYNRPYLDLTVKAEVKYVDEREGATAPYVGNREAKMSLRIDRSEMVLLYGIVEPSDLVLPKGTRARHLLPETYLSPEVRSGERVLVIALTPEVPK